MEVIERLEEHYEVREVPFGRSYKRCPECIVLECGCGERLTFERSALAGSGVSCECGADLTSDIQEKLQGHQPEVRGQEGLEDREATEHPWLHDAGAQEEQHLRDEATYSEGSPWRYNDVRYRSLQEEQQDVE